jgi:diguanylate cyclase (GGDEF)-like protein
VWALWRRPGRVVGWFLATEVVATGLTVTLVLSSSHRAEDWWRFALLCGLALLQAEVGGRVERTRKLHVTVTSAWVFAGVVLLPPDLAGGLLIVADLHKWLRFWRGRQKPPHVKVFDTAMILNCTYAAAGALALCRFLGQRLGWPDPVTVAASLITAALTFLVVNSVLVVIAARVHGKRERLFPPVESALELAALGLGACAAVAVERSAYLAILVLPPIIVLHRAVLIGQLEEQASTDQKTGLLNAAAWHEHARRELARARRTGSSFGVLILDLDHFKRVNDTYGHLAGDEVLNAVARLLAKEVGARDSAGRFGGEEFVVLISDTTAAQVVAFAERIRQRICELGVAAPADTGTRTVTGLSASIGVAVYPAGGDTVDQLLRAADFALYTAKSNGRNQIA